MALQQQIAILDKFVIQQESIPSFIPPNFQHNIPNLKASDKNDLIKNVSCFFFLIKLFFCLFQFFLFNPQTQSSIIEESLEKSTHLIKKLSTSDPNLKPTKPLANDAVSLNGLENLPKPESTAGCAIM